MTREEIARDFSLSHETVRRIEAMALRKLRHPSRSQLLRQFIDHSCSAYWAGRSDGLGNFRHLPKPVCP